MTIKVTDFELEALSSLAEVTGLTKFQIMRLALAGKALELGRGAVKVPRAAPLWNQTTENTPRTIASSRESCFRMMDIVDPSLSTRSIRATGPGFTMITMLGNPHQFKLRQK